jgi:hypothetical protein
MVDDFFFSQVVLLALVWRCLMLQWAWPSDCATAHPTPPRPTLPRRQRSREPKPLVGLTTKPPCDACAHAGDSRPHVSAAPPPRIVTQRSCPRAGNFFPPPGNFFPLRVTYLGEKRQQALERRWHSGGATCGACHMTWKAHRHLANQRNGLAGEQHATGQKVKSQIYSPSSHA